MSGWPFGLYGFLDCKIAQALFVDDLDALATGGGDESLGGEVFEHSGDDLSGGAHIFRDLLVGELYCVAAGL